MSRYCTVITPPPPRQNTHNDVTTFKAHMYTFNLEDVTTPATRVYTLQTYPVW